MGGIGHLKDVADLALCSSATGERGCVLVVHMSQSCEGALILQELRISNGDTILSMRLLSIKEKYYY